jgi:hypothetical protein
MRVHSDCIQLPTLAAESRQVKDRYTAICSSIKVDRARWRIHVACDPRVSCPRVFGNTTDRLGAWTLSMPTRLPDRARGRTPTRYSRLFSSKDP